MPGASAANLTYRKSQYLSPEVLSTASRANPELPSLSRVFDRKYHGHAAITALVTNLCGSLTTPPSDTCTPFAVRHPAHRLTGCSAS